MVGLFISAIEMTQVACYVDGFNLYHAIEDLGKPHLKWVNIWSLAESICRPGETLVKVVYFSAYATWMPDRYARHREYVRALKHSGVECHMARFSNKDMTCKSCGTSWVRHEEKETDVHFSLRFLEDAIDDVFDRAIIVSAEGDYVPAVRRVRTRHPGKQVFLAAPPKRRRHARELLNSCNSGIEITQGRIAQNLFPERIHDGDGGVVAVRPVQYDPPA